MNLLLFDSAELDAQGRVVVRGRRARHLMTVLRVEAGRALRAGLLSGPRGLAHVEEVLGDARDGAHARGGDEGAVALRFVADGAASPRPRVDMMLALPRPKALRRLLATAATFGVGEITLMNAWRVDKSYFSSPLVSPSRLREALILGCEQGGTTWVPKLRTERRFMGAMAALPRAEDDDRLRLLFEPQSAEGLGTLHPWVSTQRLLVAVGPEGGWIDRELQTFAEGGFRALSLGSAILPSATAVSAILAQVDLLAALGAAKETGGSEAHVEFEGDTEMTHDA